MRRVCRTLLQLMPTSDEQSLPSSFSYELGNLPTHSWEIRSGKTKTCRTVLHLRIAEVVKYCVCSHAGYGSYTESFPALLPFLAAVPASLLCGAPQRPAGVVAALWTGCQSLTSDAARVTAVDCFTVASLSSTLASADLRLPLPRSHSDLHLLAT